MNQTCLPGCRCDCCTGTAKLTPRTIANPGDAGYLHYRVGDYRDFFASMKAALSTVSIERDPTLSVSAALLGGVLKGTSAPSPKGGDFPLSALTARTSDDFAIALLDAWAIVLDVVTFYQERIANEGYLPTATEFRSVLELARLVGYEPRPGVSSRVALAYTLEKDSKVTIRAGSKAQSVPASGQTPQLFETSADLEARDRFNAFIPRKARPQRFESGQTASGRRIWLTGLATQLQPNDPLLLVFDGTGGEPFRVRRVEPNNSSQTTMITLQDFARIPVSKDAEETLKQAKREIETAIRGYESSLDPALAIRLRLKSIVEKILAIVVTKVDATNAIGEIKKNQNRILPDGAEDAKVLEYLEQTIQSLNLALTDEAVKAAVKDRLNALNDLFEQGKATEVSQLIHAAEIIEVISATASDDAIKSDSLRSTLESQLVELRKLKVPTEGDVALPRLVCLLAQLERTQDRLILNQLFQQIELVINVPTGNAELDTALDDSLKKWRVLANQVESGIALANSFAEQTFAVRQLVREANLFISAPTPKIDLNGVSVYNRLGSNTFYTARSVVRDIVTRYLTPALAGVDADCRLVRTATCRFDKIRRQLSPEVLEIDLLTTLLSELQNVADQHAHDDFKNDELGTLLVDLKAILPKSTVEVKNQKIGEATSRYLKLSGDRRSALDAMRASLNANLPADLDDSAAPITGGLLGGGGVTGAAELKSIDDVRKVLADVKAISVGKDVVDFLKKAGESLSSLADYVDWRKTLFEDLDAKRDELNAGWDDASAVISDLLLALPLIKNVTDFLLPQLQIILSGLRQDRRIAEAGNYPRVVPWLDELIQELERLTGELNIAFAGDRESSGGFKMPDLTRLGKPPARTPAPGASSRRVLAASVTPGDSNTSALSDSVSKLVASFDDRIGSSLFAAMANSKTERRNRFQGMFALRAKASPFGHNAPSRQILLREGGSADLGDWPLVQELVRVRAYGVPNLNSATVEIEVTDRAGSHTFVRLPNGKTEAKENKIAFLIVRKDKSIDISLSGAVERKFALQIDGPPSSFTAVVSSNELVAEIAVGEETVKVGTHGYLHFSSDREKKILTVISQQNGTPLDATFTILRLDAQYDKVVPGSYVAILRRDPNPAIPNPLVARVESIGVASPKDFGLPGGKITVLSLDRPWLSATDFSLASIRDTAVFLQSEKLELAAEPYDADIGPVTDSPDETAGYEIELDELYEGVPEGRWLVVSGTRTDIPGTTGVKASERVMVAGVTHLGDTVGGTGQGRPHTLLRLATPLSYSYERLSATVFGNVVEATHGETKQEILGSGNAAAANQKFYLKQGPLTYLSAPTPSGAADTLQVRVNGVLWEAKSRLADLGPDDRGFTFQADENGSIRIQFGDGIHGHRLPTGAENVRAAFRVGSGRVGNLPEGKITQLISRPLGVREVTNPVAAIGGMDRQTVAEARHDAPIGLASLDRLVSIADYADFARGYAGIAKALAVKLSNGFAPCIHLTLAGRGDAVIDPASDSYQNLLAALRKYGDPALPLAVDPRRLRPIVLEASIRIDPRFEFKPVAAAVRQKLLDAYSFAARELGQDVLRSDLVELMHSIRGVEAVRIDRLGLIQDKDKDGNPTRLEDLNRQIQEIAESHPPERLHVATAKLEAGDFVPAELAYFLPQSEQTLLLNEWTP